MNDDLRRRLREAAAAYRPDRERMLARVERGTAASGTPVPRRTGRASPWLRVAGATAAVAAVLAAGGYGASAVLGGQEQPVGAAPPAHSTAPDERRTEDGPLWSDGSVDPHSNDFWAQSNVTLKTAEPLTALTVELRIAHTGGVASTGAWRTLPEGDFTFRTDTGDGFLVYRWRLRPGRTVPAGTHVFAGQYDHARGGRDAGADSYSVTARSDDQQARIRGDFAPQNGR
ncbi:hypothetical protein [Streptomyces purpurogeneiscleroticus]|uniref:hypothetical protein n=1 Tax=Streptomyces purpurogeneiscleroticus TaxID=68259 RepID=UPI001CBAE049|nr:hypothetical protein [Streptomyces purpurogeneiscleroticus]MBZ4017525.1 hypothetical protein [Streptomyces purpurogeneiscleroticus]